LYFLPKISIPHQIGKSCKKNKYFRIFLNFFFCAKADFLDIYPGSFSELNGTDQLPSHHNAYI